MDYSNKRKSFNGIWDDGYNVRGGKCRTAWTLFSPRVRIRWTSSMWNRYRSYFGQKLENMRPAIKEWAAGNAFTLVFITIMFIITWIWILVAVAFFGGTLT